MLKHNFTGKNGTCLALAALLLSIGGTALAADCKYPQRIDPTTGAPACWPHPTMDTAAFGKITLERFEWRGGGDGGYAWQASAWYGTDYNQLGLKTEGEGLFGKGVEVARVEVLYSRLISPYFNLLAGLRQDLAPNPERTFGVLGLSGLAPYGFETEIELYISAEGDVSLEGEFEYELLLTQKLTLVPRFEFKLAAQDVPEHDVGRGLTHTEFGLRLRYALTPRLAPYIGIRHERRYGDTRELAQDTADSAVVLGLRAWF